MSKIILIEPDNFQAETTASELREAFPNLEVVEFSILGDFLQQIQSVKEGDILVTEARLPLLFPEEDSKKLDTLAGCFPSLFFEWSYKKGASLLIRELRGLKYSSLPIIIYTTFYFDGEEDVEISDSFTFVCEKQPDSITDLVKMIKASLRF